jgi:hypothetical protein
MREWLSQLIMYSMTITLSGLWESYFTLGQGLLKMVGEIHGVQVTDDDVEESLAVPPSTCFMVACHVWDTVGAQSAGYTAGLITRPGNAPLPVASLPRPNLIAPDLPALADQLIQRWRS